MIHTRGNNSTIKRPNRGSQSKEEFRRDLQEQIRLKEERIAREKAEELAFEQKFIIPNEKSPSRWLMEGGSLNKHPRIHSKPNHVEFENMVETQMNHMRENFVPTHEEIEALRDQYHVSPSKSNSNAYVPKTSPLSTRPNTASSHLNRSQDSFTRFRFESLDPNKQDELTRKHQARLEQRKALEEQLKHNKMLREAEIRAEKERERREAAEEIAYMEVMQNEARKRVNSRKQVVTPKLQSESSQPKFSPTYEESPQLRSSDLQTTGNIQNKRSPKQESNSEAHSFGSGDQPDRYYNFSSSHYVSKRTQAEAAQTSNDYETRINSTNNNHNNIPSAHMNYENDIVYQRFPNQPPKIAPNSNVYENYKNVPTGHLNYKGSSVSHSAQAYSEMQQHPIPSNFHYIPPVPPPTYQHQFQQPPAIPSYVSHAPTGMPIQESSEIAILRQELESDRAQLRLMMQEQAQIIANLQQETLLARVERESIKTTTHEAVNIGIQQHAQSLHVPSDRTRFKFNDKNFPKFQTESEQINNMNASKTITTSEMKDSSSKFVSIHQVSDIKRKKDNVPSNRIHELPSESTQLQTEGLPSVSSYKGELKNPLEQSLSSFSKFVHPMFPFEEEEKKFQEAFEKIDEADLSRIGSPKVSSVHGDNSSIAVSPSKNIITSRGYYDPDHAAIEELESEDDEDELDIGLLSIEDSEVQKILGSKSVTQNNTSKQISTTPRFQVFQLTTEEKDAMAEVEKSYLAKQYASSSSSHASITSDKYSSTTSSSKSSQSSESLSPYRIQRK